MRLCGIVQGIFFLITGFLFALFIETRFTIFCTILFLIQALLQIYVYNQLRQKQIDVSMSSETERVNYLIN